MSLFTQSPNLITNIKPPLPLTQDEILQEKLEEEKVRELENQYKKTSILFLLAVEDSGSGVSMLPKDVVFQILNIKECYQGVTLFRKSIQFDLSLIKARTTKMEEEYEKRDRELTQRINEMKKWQAQEAENPSCQIQ